MCAHRGAIIVSCISSMSMFIWLALVYTHALWPWKVDFEPPQYGGLLHIHPLPIHPLQHGRSEVEHVLKARKQEVSVWNVISLIHSLSHSTALGTVRISPSLPMPHFHADRHTRLYVQLDRRTYINTICTVWDNLLCVCVCVCVCMCMCVCVFVCVKNTLKTEKTLFRGLWDASQAAAWCVSKYFVAITVRDTSEYLFALAYYNRCSA